MSARQHDQLHDHQTWHSRVRAESSEDSRLHRHRVIEPGTAVRYTTWAHDTGAHAHRLPDGAWTRPRRSLTPPAPLAALRDQPAPAVQADPRSPAAAPAGIA